MSDEHTSSTQAIPDVRDVPRHIAIIMDGNGRWARRRFLPRAAGHKRGIEVIDGVVESCVERGVEFLTVFAFSSENWRRPPDEVSFLMRLFIGTLERKVAKLHENNIRFRVIGDISAFEPRLVRLVEEAEKLTRDNTKLTLTVAANYGGRWDVVQAANRMLQEKPALATDGAGFTEADLKPYLSLAYAPEPDLFIRTGGEQRISNFLLWQMAYTEMYFTETLWPDFNRAALDHAIASYQKRERRFGRTSEQLQSAETRKVVGDGS